MRKLALNIISINPQNVSILVLAVASGVWFVVWAVLLTDIAKHPRSMLWKFAWALLSAIPVVGGVFYATNELLCSDWSAAFHWRNHESKAKKNR